MLSEQDYKEKKLPYVKVEYALMDGDEIGYIFDGLDDLQAFVNANPDLDACPRLSRQVSEWLPVGSGG